MHVVDTFSTAEHQYSGNIVWGSQCCERTASVDVGEYLQYFGGCSVQW